MAIKATLRGRISKPSIIVAPGVYDALTASIAESCGFEALYLSGAGIAYTKLGRPDIGLVSMSEVADTLAHICERVETPVIVDADTGYGNALNVQRTVKVFETAGASALQLEDQTYPKRCGHLSGKQLIGAKEMAGKIRAAVDARTREDTVIIARTDAVAVEGLEAAFDRAALYLDAGADMLFIEAPRNQSQLGDIASRFAGRAPLMANMVEGGATPVLPAHELEKLGYRLVIFPGGIVRALARAASDFYGALHRDGTSQSMRNSMYDFDGLNALLGTEKMLAHGKSYEDEA
jgi:2-methylisocitrate lyase-like PEP mutase family enzyme